MPFPPIFFVNGTCIFVNDAYTSIIWCLDFINGAYGIVNAFKMVTVVFINGAYRFLNAAPTLNNMRLFSPNGAKNFLK